MAVTFALRGVSYRYRGGGRDIFSGLDLDLFAGETTALMGRSGVGKSTLLNLLGLLWEGELTAGQIAYHDGGGPGVRFDDRTLTADDRARLRLRDFGFVLQSSYLLSHFPCGDNVAMPLLLGGAGRRDVRDRVLKLMNELDRTGELPDLYRRPAREASVGQRQRLAVLRALVHEPRVVFADEPFSSLDEENRELVLEMLHAWRRRTGTRGDRTLVLVCHDLNVAWQTMRDGEPLVQRFVLMRRAKDGVVVEALRREEIATEGVEGMRRRLFGEGGL